MRIYRDRASRIALQIARKRIPAWRAGEFSEGYEIARMFRPEWPPVRCALWALDDGGMDAIAAEIRKAAG